MFFWPPNDRRIIGQNPQGKLPIFKEILFWQLENCAQSSQIRPQDKLVAKCQGQTKPPVLTKRAILYILNALNMENDIKLPNEKQGEKKKPVSPTFLIEAGLEFAVILALPLGLFVYLGKKLDTKYNTHLFVILGLFLALGLSSYMIYKKINQYKKLLK